MRVWFLFLGFVLLASSSWGGDISLTPTDSWTPKEKKEWAARVKALKNAGAQLGVDGKLRIFGYDLKAKNVADFGLEGDEIKEAQKDPADFATNHVDLSTSPDGRWTVVHLDNNMENDFWIYDRHSKTAPQYFESGGRFDRITWIGSRLFWVEEGCSVICSGTQFFKPEDVGHPSSADLGEFIDYDPRRDLYVTNADDGVEMGHPFGNRKSVTFFIEKGFRKKCLGMMENDPENVSELKDKFDGDKLEIDFQTQGGRKVHKEFDLGRF